jgi:uncharacterized protein (UPF0548 family)
MKWHLSASLKNAPFDESRWQHAGPPTSLAEAKKGRNEQFTLVLLITERTPEFQRVTERALERLWRYQIFHPRRLKGHICHASGEITVGAIVIQRIFLEPFGFESATRVVDRFDRRHHTGRSVGFTYATLPGHPEIGRETFTLRLEDGPPHQLILTMDVWSRPGHWSARLIPGLNRWIQRRSSLQALTYFRDCILAKD